MDRLDDLAACPLYLQQLPNCPACAGLIDESGAEPRRLRLAQRIPVAGPTGCLIKQRGAATRTAVQAEREPSSQAARNIRFPASTLEDRGQT
jgi:hypothetical protein